VQLTASIPGNTYSWSTSTTDISRTITAYGPGTYTVWVTINPCTTVSASVTVTTASGTQTCCHQGRYADTTHIIANQNSLIQSLVPNPAQEMMEVYYSLAKDVGRAELLITNIYGQIIARTKLDPNNEKANVDCSSFANGIYFTSLLVNDEAVNTKKLVIAK
jgi:hypothetical protein